MAAQTPGGASSVDGAPLGSEDAPGALRRFRDRAHAWREGIRTSPRKHRIYKITVGVVGGAVVLGGVVLLPLPGPGWVIIFIGLAILASEFESADRLQQYARRQVHRWTEWIKRQHIAVRLLVGLATFAFVAAVLYVVFRISGVPGWVPDAWYAWIPGL